MTDEQHEDLIEKMAENIYNIIYFGPAAAQSDWSDGKYSVYQKKARQCAEAVLAIIRPARGPEVAAANMASRAWNSRTELTDEAKAELVKSMIPDLEWLLAKLSIADGPVKWETPCGWQIKCYGSISRYAFRSNVRGVGWSARIYRTFESAKAAANEQYRAAVCETMGIE